MSINSKTNIELLIQLHINNPLYKSNKKYFIELLLSQINIIHRNRLKYNNNLTVMNKEILNIIEKITRDHINSNKIHINNNDFNNNDFNNNDFKLNQKVTNNLTPNNSEIRLNPRPQIQSDDNNTTAPRLKIFEEKLKKQQDDFNSLNMIKKPKDIDFTDKNKDSPLEYSVFDSTIKKRDEEINNIVKNYDSQKTKSWLAPKSTLTDARKLESNNNDKKGGKRVSFNLDNNIEDITSSHSFLSKLKPINNNVEESNNTELLDSNNIEPIESNNIEQTNYDILPIEEMSLSQSETPKPQRPQPQQPQPLTPSSGSTFSLPEILNNQQIQLNKHQDILDKILKNQETILSNQTLILKKSSNI